ncbi:MAG: outer membrane protein assembly factor BamD [Bacteroidales bacterium]|nr:MAG: outer membrane protein assembly factor BamD [Bacteroidales bacterium]
MRKNYLFTLLLALLVISCSRYEKILKSSDYNLKYRKAFEYYNKGEYVRASTLFDQISAVFRGSNKADSVYYHQAMSYFHQNDFILAGHYFDNFVKTYGNSKFAEDATYYKAYCHYRNSPRPSLDQTNTVQAIQAFQLFVIKYPNSARKDECNNIITELREKLVEKSFMSARLYFDLEDYKASLVALNTSLNEYPDSKFREDIMFLILKSSYLLAFYSVDKKKKERYQASLDEYYSFIAEFPESEYRKEADRMYENTSKILRIDNDINKPEDGL